ncbi:hypothetical protein BST61_g2990 [Cercospora zeina]
MAGVRSRAESASPAPKLTCPAGRCRAASALARRFWICVNQHDSMASNTTSVEMEGIKSPVEGPDHVGWLSQDIFTAFRTLEEEMLYLRVSMEIFTTKTPRKDSRSSQLLPVCREHNGVGLLFDAAIDGQGIAASNRSDPGQVWEWKQNLCSLIMRLMVYLRNDFNLGLRQHLGRNVHNQQRVRQEHTR